MTFALVFLLNACLSFALSLVVAALIGPDAFGRYAVALAVSVVINTALFEWLRLSTTRFVSERVAAEEPDVRATLLACYAGAAALLVLGSILLLALVPDPGLPPTLLAAASGVGLAVGFFDFRTAAARARFRDGRYAALLALRGILAFGLAAAAALVWGEPTAILLGAAAAAIVAMALVRDPWAARSGRPRRELVAAFARYGLPLVAASAAYQLLPLLNRSVLAGRAGFTEAAYFALAGEIAVRLFQNLGSALDLALFQLAVRAQEAEGDAGGGSQVGRNAGSIAALILPAGTGLCAVWPSFEALFVPPLFRGHVAAAMMLSVPAFVAYALVQYALNPVFQLRRRTGPVIAAALVAVAVDAALLFAWPGALDAVGVAAIQLAALGSALAVLAGLAIRSGAVLPWRDAALSALASALMIAALWPWRTALPPSAGLPLQSLAGAALYGALALAFDIAGARALLGLGERRVRAMLGGPADRGAA